MRHRRPGQDAARGVEEIVARAPAAAGRRPPDPRAHRPHRRRWCRSAARTTSRPTIHPDDRGHAQRPRARRSAARRHAADGRLDVGEPDDVREITDGGRARLAGLDLRVDLAPGHTAGSVTFRTAGRSADDRAGAVLRRPALRRLDRPHRPARRLVREILARCASVPAARRTRRWCCPATDPRRPSAASAPPTRSWRGAATTGRPATRM